MDAIQASVNFRFGVFYCFSHLATEAGYLLFVSICLALSNDRAYNEW